MDWSVEDASSKIRSFLGNVWHPTKPHNLHLWYGPEEICQLCCHPNPNLQHILSSCKAALTQGRYRWRDDQVLRKLAEVIEACRLEANKASPARSHGLIQFVRQGGEVLSNSTKEWLLLSPGSNWELRADLDHQLKLPQQMAVTSLQPDILLCGGLFSFSTVAKRVRVLFKLLFIRFEKKVCLAVASSTLKAWRLSL